MVGAERDDRPRIHQVLDGRELADGKGSSGRERGHDPGFGQRDRVATVCAQQVVGRHRMQLRRETRAAGALQLVGVDARNELRLQTCLQDRARLRHAEITAVAEHVAESRAGQIGVVAPLGDLFRIRG